MASELTPPILILRKCGMLGAKLVIATHAYTDMTLSKAAI